MTDISVSADVETPDALAPAHETDAVQQDSAATDETQGGDGEGEEGQSDNEPFPKKAVNALNRAKREKRQLRAQVKALEAQMAELKGANPTASYTPPDPNKFDSYTEFNNANVQHQIKTAMEEAQNKGKLEALEGQRNQLAAQRNAELAHTAAETAKQLPDLPNVVGQYAQQLDSVSADVAEIIYEMDNAPLAVYTLAKEGILEDVLSAPPYIAAVHLMNAQARGERLLGGSRMAKPTVTAPEPIRAAKGTGVNSQPLHARTGKDLLNWVRS